METLGLEPCEKRPSPGFVFLKFNHSSKRKPPIILVSQSGHLSRKRKDLDLEPFSLKVGDMSEKVSTSTIMMREVYFKLLYSYFRSLFLFPTAPYRD